MDSDATWCARCKTVIHNACLELDKHQCPKCGTAYDPPDHHFVFSAVCPACFSPQAPSSARCKHCGKGTRWDDEGAYGEFTKQIRRAARRNLYEGLAAVAVGVACLGLFSLMIFSVRPVAFGALLIGFFISTAHGIRRLMLSRNLRRFK
jgi:hypothetical protein